MTGAHMIARMWHGMVPRSKADEYRDLMQGIALPEYQATQGNRGAWCLFRADADVAHFEMLTMWDDTDAIKRFAGDDYSLAKYYDFDPEYLIEMEPGVQHYDVYAQHSAVPSESTGVGDDSRMMARVWKGVVPAGKAEAYSRYLAGFGFDDYGSHPGNLGVYLLRRAEAAQVHVLLLSFWTSRDAIMSYAGADIDRAHYYSYDLECLISPAPRVEHYNVRRAAAPRRAHL
jgi:heme-degrading monooxygenase HmoA